MKPSCTTCRQRGFTIVAGIFLLVILSALGGFMLTLSNTQHLSAARDLQGSRAYWAAKAGIQWQAARLSAGNPCGAVILNLDGFTVAVTCTANSYTEGTTTKTVYWVGSTASSGGGVGSIGYVERSLNAFMEF